MIEKSPFTPIAPTASAVAVFAVLLLMSQPAFGFLFTEDADINDPGQLESETSLELGFQTFQPMPVLNQEFNLGVHDRVEVGAFSGMGLDFDKSLIVANPGLQAKFMLHRAEEGPPAVGLMVGAIGPWATGSAELPAPAGFALVPVTFEFDNAAVHAQLGWAAAGDDGLSSRPIAGIAGELGIGDLPVALLGEVVNADPYEPTGSPLAMQTGFVWEIDDGLEAEVLTAAFSEAADGEPVLQEIGVGLQAGVRLVLPVFD